jgi:hypothetical protein
VAEGVPAGVGSPAALAVGFVAVMRLIDVSAEVAEAQWEALVRVSRGAALGVPVVALPSGFIVDLGDGVAAMAGTDLDTGVCWRIVDAPGLPNPVVTEWR